MIDCTQLPNPPSCLSKGLFHCFPIIPSQLTSYHLYLYILLHVFLLLTNVHQLKMDSLFIISKYLFVNTQCLKAYYIGLDAID